jgi:integrase
MPRLSAKRVASEAKAGLHGDGGGLYLRVGPTGGKSWILRTVVHGHRRDLGIGSAALVSLSEAREIAHRLRKEARSGGDPDALRRREVITFEAAARRVHQNLLPTWRSQRHGEIWLGALERYVFPLIGRRQIDTVGTADILRVLEPIWTTKFDTANRVKQRLAAIFDWAKGAGHYPHENPVNGLKKALPSVKGKQTHRPALAWRELPSFMSELADRAGVSARALEFIILTAARSGEARGARWAEVLDGVWTIPADRMKTGQSHRVPLSKGALECLQAVQGLDDEFIFPSPSRDESGRARPMSDTVFKALMDRMKWTGLTTHGFRSTFRDWCSEAAHADREVAEAALSHTLGSKVERAYARSDLFERRGSLMEQWSAFSSGANGKIVRFAKR